jgi:hypothetical protein
MWPFRLMQRPWLLALAVGLFGLEACSGGGREPRQDEGSTTRQRRAPSVRPSVARPVLDLPAALQLHPAGFSARFGSPTAVVSDFADPGKFSVASTVSADSLALFQVQSLTMIVAFSRSTGAVQDVLLLGADEASLMRQASLVPEAPGYLILPVFQPRRADQLFGLRVVPK